MIDSTIGLLTEAFTALVARVRAIELREGSSTALNVVDYGAKGNDPNHDDWPGIQAAIDKAAEMGGGFSPETVIGDDAAAIGAPQVFLPGRRWYISKPLTIYSKTSLMGAGIESTIIYLLPGSNCDMIRGYNFAALHNSDSIFGCANFSIQNLTLEGNRTNQTPSSGCGLRVYGLGYILNNFRVRHCSGDGIYTEWSKTQLGGGFDGTMESHWTNIMVHDCGDNGIVMAGPHDAEWAVGTVHSNNKNGTGGRGVWVVNNALMTGGGFTVSDVHVWGSHSYAWDFQDSVRITNCMAEGALISQVRFGSNGTDTYKASEAIWMGGDIFSGPGLGQTAVEIGGDGFAPVSIQMYARVENLLGELVKFSVPSAGGHVLRFVTYLVGGVVYTGTPQTGVHGDYIEAIVSGGGGPASLVKFPISPTVPSGEGLQSSEYTDDIRFKPGGATGFAVVGKGAATVNYPVANPATGGNGVGFFADGSDSQIDFAIVGKGVNSRISLRPDFSAAEALLLQGTAGAVNNFQMNNASAGNEPALSVQGSDTNINMLLQPKGTGLIHIGYNSSGPSGVLAGTGPGGTTQQVWLPFRDNNDGIVWVPCWK